MEIHNAPSNRTLPAIRLGKNNVVDPADLTSFLQARQTGK
jgi:hypothetical protein